MNHLELKNKVLSELQLISDMAIQDSKNNGCDVDYLLSPDCTIWGKKQEDKIAGLIGYNKELFPDNVTLEYDTAKYEFDITQVASLHTAVKNKWGNGKVSVKNKTAHQLNGRSKELQSEIMKYREAYQNGSYSYNEYQGSYYGYSKTKTLFKEQVIEMYQRAKPGDLIRLCWRFITNPENLEGVHYSWINPQVKFEPYREVSEMPKYYRDKLQEVA